MRISTYDVSQAGLTTQQPRATMDPKQAATLGNEVQDLAQGLSSLGEHYKQLKNQDEVFNGKHALDQGLDKIHVEKMTNPDVHKAIETLDQDYQKLVDEVSTKYVSDSETRNRFKEEALLATDRRKSTLQTALYNRASQLYKGKFNDRMDHLQNEYLHTLPNLQPIIIKEMQREAQNAINVGGVHADFVNHRLQTTINNLGAKQLKTDLSLADSAPDPKNSIDNIEAELKKGDQGRYKNIPAERRDEAMRNVASAKARAVRTEKERIRNINHITDKNMTWKYIHGALTQDELDTNFNKMSPERYKTLSEGLLSGKISETNHPEEYSKAMDFIGDEKNSERDSLNKILDLEKDGKLTSDEAHSLAKMFMVPPEGDPVFKLEARPNLAAMLKAQEEKNNLSKDKRTQAKGWWEALKEHFGGRKAEANDAARKIINEYNGQQNQGEKDKPDWGQNQLKKAIKDDVMKNNPKLRNVHIPETGLMIMDANGNKAMVYPDFSYREVSQ